MKSRKYMWVVLSVLILLLFIGSASAAEANETDILSIDESTNIINENLALDYISDNAASNDTNVVENNGNNRLSASNGMVADNLKTSEKNNVLKQANDCEILGMGTDMEILGADEIHINDTNFNLYFDENSTLNDNVSSNSTIFIGEITNKSLYINKPVIVIPDETSKIMDSNITFISGSDGSTVRSLTFNNTNGLGAIAVLGARDITVLENIISIASNINETGSAIFAQYANNFNATANTITYHGKTDGKNNVAAVIIIQSEYAVIEDNKFEIIIPSGDIVSRELSPGINVDVPVSMGVLVYNSTDLSFNRNEIYLSATDILGSNGTIYIVDILDSDNVQFDENEILAGGNNSIRGLVISGEYLDVIENSFSIKSYTANVYGIDIEGKSSGTVEDNDFFILSPTVAYPIYSPIDENTMEVPSVDYIGNVILADADAVYGMYLNGANANITGNKLSINGNYTMGIYSFMTDGPAIFENNEIEVSGFKNDTKDTGDRIAAQTVGILAATESTIKFNIIESDGNYTIVSNSSDSKITDNYLIASELRGDDSVNDRSDKAIVENNFPNSENNYNLTNETFFLFFDEYGYLKEGITGNLTFIDEFSNLVKKIYITEQVNLFSDNATLNNIKLEILNDDVTVEGFNFISDSLDEVICIENANNVSILLSNFNINGLADSDNAVIHIVDSNNVNIDINEIALSVLTNGTYRNNVILAEYCDNLVISNNNISAILPSRSIDWGSGVVYSEGVCLEDCDNALLDNNTIGAIASDKIDDYGTVYALHITGDNDTVENSIIAATNVSYGYALVISGKNYLIHDNHIGGQEGDYLCAIDVESNSDGSILDNNITVEDVESAYGIYTADWDGDVQTNITNNNIGVKGTNVFAMSLSGSEALVNNNTVEMEGNFTTGIASTVDEIFIINNTIVADGTNAGTPTSYDSMGIETIGVHIVSGDALVKYNNITSNSEYTVSVEGTGAVTDNYLVAKEYTGDASVNSVPGDTLVANNTPSMQRAIVSAENVVMYYKDGTKYVILLTDQNGKALSNETVVITLNDVAYNKTTDQNGTASVDIDLVPGNYSASVLYVGKNNFTNASTENNITVNKIPVTIKLTEDSYEVYVGEDAVIGVILPDDATGIVLVNVGDKKYYGNVENGNVTVIVAGLSEGNYTAEIIYPGDDYYAKANASVGVKVDAKPASKSQSSIAIVEVNGFNITGILMDIEGKAIANAPIAYTVNGTAGTTTTSDDGSFTIEVVNGAKVDIEYGGNETILPTNMTLTFNIPEVPVVVKIATHFDINDRAITINGYAVDGPAGEQGIYYATTLLDANGKPVSNVYIEFAVNNKIYNRTTYENGSFKPYKLNMVRAGRYTMAFNFAGDENYTNAFACVCVDLDKKPITIKALSKTYKVATKIKKYTVTLSTIKGLDGKMYLSPKKVSIKVNGKTYTGTTNSKGSILFKITNLDKKAKYKATITYEGDKTYESASKTVTLTVK